MPAGPQEPHITVNRGHSDSQGRESLVATGRRRRRHHWAETSLGGRRLFAIIAMAISTRLSDWLLGYVCYRLLPHAYPRIPRGFLSASSWIPGLRLWSNWDGLWYLSIAHLGYHGRVEATAFFPLYPLLVSGLGATVLAGVIVSWAAFGVGLVFLWQMTSDRDGPRIAWYTVIGCITWPTAFFYGAVYTESLFFALATAALYCGQRRAYAASAVLSGVASAVSIYGMLLAVVLAGTMIRHRRKGLTPPQPWSYLLMTPLGLFSYMGFLWLRFGHPLMFERVQYHWGRHRGWPWLTLLRGFHSAWRARAVFDTGNVWLPFTHAANNSINIWNFLFYATAIGLVLFIGWRLPVEWLAYTGLSLMLPLFDPARAEPLMSFPRLFLSSVPLFPALGMILARSRLARGLYFLLAIPLGLWMLARFVTFRWVG